MENSKYYTWGASGNKMWLKGCKYAVFAKQTNAIGTGNYLANTIKGFYVCPETRKHDLKMFGMIESPECSRWMAKHCSEKVVLTEVFVHKGDFKDILGYVVDRLDGTRPLTFTVSRYNTSIDKREDAVRIVADIIEEENNYRASL